jgi:UDP-N-acetylmuramoyl-tripeptide--D-alanyl-D-alanine ligase
MALSQVTFGGIAIDSRVVRPGDLFVALLGEHVDGHQFVRAALERGAQGALVRRSWLHEHASDWDADAAIVEAPELSSDVTGERPLVIAVDDPLATLQQLAHLHRRRMGAQVIGITGSVGKTSTKEAAAAVLRQHFKTLYSGKSYNNEIGVPLTLLRLEPEHEVAVVEMGTYGLGEIALLCQWAEPNIGIVTNVGVSHLERMGSPDVVAVAKRELIESLPSDGVAILNNDDPRVRAMAEHTDARCVFYGSTADSDIWADNIERRGLGGIAFDVHYRGETHRLETSLLGQHAIYIALPVIAAGLVLGMTWNAIAAGLRDEAMQRRISVVRGVNGATVLDDTYNASPASCQAALDLLADVPGRRVAVFGDMAELGPIEEEGHRSVGQAAAAVVDQLVVVGDKARWIGEAAQQRRALLPVVYANTNAEAAAALRPLLTSDTVILVKGARVARTEEIVDALRASEEMDPS